MTYITFPNESIGFSKFPSEYYMTDFKIGSTPLNDVKTIDSVIENNNTSNNIGYDTSNFEKTLLNISKCRKMIILYEDWSEYCVSNPRDIYVVKNKSGLIDIYYTRYKFENVKTEFGSKVEDKIEEFSVENCRINGIQIQYHSKRDYKKSELYEF